MGRSIARELAMQMLYARLCGGEGSAGEIWAMTALPQEKTDKRNFRRADAQVQSVLAMQEALDARIQPLLHSWSFERIDWVALCILRLAAYEMLHDPEMAVAIAINEAVELAKTFGGDNSYAFVNGVLGGLAKQLDPGEEPILSPTDLQVQETLPTEE